jgi:hypothetical protein
MSAYEFISRNPITVLLLAYIAYRLVFLCWNRLMRHLNVRRAGWPPAHLDADGDWKPEPKPEAKP